MLKTDSFTPAWVNHEESRSVWREIDRLHRLRDQQEDHRAMNLTDLQKRSIPTPIAMTKEFNVWPAATLHASFLGC
jgi:hypothetical protein